jgi:hypothetical protein
MRKLISFFTVTTALAALASACAVEAPTEEEMNLGTAEEAVSSCTNPEGTNAMIAALAVAIGKELKRWQITTDFKLVAGPNWQTFMELTPTGLAQCTNGCANVKALLFFQDSRYDGQVVFPGGIKLSSYSYAARLVAGYGEQKVCEGRPANNTDPNNCAAEQHKLSLAYTSPGPCDTNYTFNARNPWGGMLQNPALLKNKLLWTGTTNPYVAFTSTNSTVTIDPTWGLIDGDNTTSGSCQTVCTKISTTTNYVGACCQVTKNGLTQSGKMVQGASAASFKCPVTNCG